MDQDEQMLDLQKRRFQYTFTMHIIWRALTYDGSPLDQEWYDKFEQLTAEKYRLPENSIFRNRYKDLPEEKKRPQPKG